MSAINMNTIAKLAGVSRTTVSRALSTPDKVKPETRELILSIMEQAGYTYHAGAAELLKRRADIIGLIVPSVESIVFANATLAVQEAADDMDMSLQLGISKFKADKEASILRRFLARRVAGVIMIGFCASNEPLIHELYRNGIPVVVIWDTPNNPRICQVGVDNFRATVRVVQYLADLGHRRIAMISGPRASIGRVEERIAGYISGMEQNGLKPGLIVSDVTSIASGERRALELLAQPVLPTAIFAANDLMAIGVISGVKKCGLRVPEDVSVVGFEDTYFAAHTNPPLTSVSVPQAEMTLAATRLLKQLILHEVEAPVSYCLDTKLIVRESCAKSQDNPSHSFA